jgi:hypothetical protein
MAIDTNEPRALTAALQAPAFVTKGGGLAVHVANRHVERWAPEAGASRVRSLRSLGFVDRLVAPWLETAQRSAPLRMFSQYLAGSIAQREPAMVSWVFPRPWYQDELDWMAAARQVGAQDQVQSQTAPSMFTTRGTFVAPTPKPMELPAALYEYVAPSLSVARPETAAMQVASPLAYSPLVSAPAAHAAQIMSRMVAPIVGGQTVMPPALRAVLSSVIDRTTRAHVLAASAPELVTPPSPRDDAVAEPQSNVVAERYAEQHARIVELQRVARVATERELVAREAARPVAPAPVEIRREPVADPAERRRIEDRVAQRLAERAAGERLHDDARTAAARDAAAASTVVEPVAETRTAVAAAQAEIAAAVAALPPELASMIAAGIAQRPDRAVQTIGELGDALRTIDLLARSAASGEPFAAASGPRLMMPAGLGGLVATVERATPIAASPQRTPTMTLASLAPTNAFAATTHAAPAALQHVAWSDRWLARFAGARPQSLELLAASAHPELRMAAGAPETVFVAPTDPRAIAPAATQPVVRIDDTAETPDNMFAAISAAASRSRATASAAPKPAAPPAPTAVDRETPADRIAHAAPVAPDAGLAAQLASSPFATALRHLVPLAAAPSFDVRSLFGNGLSATFLAGLVGSSTRELVVDAPSAAARLDWQPTYVTPDAPAAAESLTTLRSTLLSLDVVAPSAVPTTASAATSTATPAATTARTMIQAMSLPMLAETADASADASWTAPGMTATRAHAWSVAQERSSSDLAFDFVTPELILAARVYGLGPAEAAQAARLAIVGPGQLAAMAGAVDRTFVQALAIEADRRDGRAVTAYPQSEAAPEAAPRATFGVERRTPRGAFLWPAATVGASGMTAATPDGLQSMSVAALEMLAAQAVAEIGTFAAFAPTSATRQAMSPTTAAPAETTGAADERDVLAAAAPLVPTARRAKFEALYLAMGQSPAAREWSPAVRAARALAIASRGEDTASARERASIVWDVLPMVYTSPGDDEPVSTGVAAQREARRIELGMPAGMPVVESRPGLGALSSRAGEALGSYVSPVAAAATSRSSSSSSREQGAVMRVPTAAQELVRTGRPAGRHGGGETEIPAWFEAAARKMFEDRSSSPADGISLAELTLVNAAPQTAIAASERGVPSSGAPSMPGIAAAAQSHAAPVDVEQIANEVYRQILVLMDAARARNGEPYL